MMEQNQDGSWVSLFKMNLFAFGLDGTIDLCTIEQIIVLPNAVQILSSNNGFANIPTSKPRYVAAAITQMVQAARRFLLEEVSVVPPTPLPPMSALERIAVERTRQIKAEGYDWHHDDSHRNDELRLAAWLYHMNALASLGRFSPLLLRDDGAPLGWPWELAAWKPKTPIRDLERAGALILAERERRLRCDPPEPILGCEIELKNIVGLLDQILGADSLASGDRPTATPCNPGERASP